MGKIISLMLLGSVFLGVLLGNMIVEILKNVSIEAPVLIVEDKSNYEDYTTLIEIINELNGRER